MWYYSHCPLVYDPEDPAYGVSAGIINDESLWPTFADWSNTPGYDSGVYASMTLGYAIHHSLRKHAVAVAQPAGPNQRVGIAIVEITEHHPMYRTFRNRTADFASCPSKVEVSLVQQLANPVQARITLV
jgi:hypothetical protein